MTYGDPIGYWLSSGETWQPISKMSRDELLEVVKLMVQNRNTRNVVSTEALLKIHSI